MGEVDGRVEGHRDGHVFVVPDEGDTWIYLSSQEMRAVLHRDRVRVRIVRFDRKGRPEGRVLDILERRKTPIIGRLLHEGGHWVVAPEDRRYGQDILIPKNATASAAVGQVVSVELTEPPSLHSKPVGRVAEVLGEIDDPGMEIEIAVRKYEVPHRFSPETLAQAAALPEKLRASDRKNRVDLTDVPLVTIDGEDARDFDDAVYCEPFRRGRGKTLFEGWRLLVAIADVSHYVKPGEPLDEDAYERATSVYFPRRVIPMLPEKLSNGLCSLNPEQDRLAMVCDMLVSTEGALEAYQFYPAVICSHARLTYTEVAAVLQNTRGPEAQRRADLVPQLVHLHEVFRALLKQRAQRGAVDFDTVETQIVCDDNGRIEKIVPRVRNDAHRLIEEAMLAANVCAADFIAHGEHPSLYRVHEGPTPEKRAALQSYLKALGLGLHLSEEPTPAEMQAISQAVQGRPDAQQIQTMLLRSMQQAIYTASNAGHFGLAYGAYTHFTSPIRRYPDLLVHRVIKALLGARRYHLVPSPKTRVPEVRRGARGGKPAKPAKPMSQEMEAWEAAGAHCSANERRADEASRDVEAWLKCRYMREHLGEEYAGTVSAVTPFGLFVTLDALYVEGLVHITELGGEYFRHDEVRQELRGERTGVRYVIGTRVQVQVSRVDLDGRRIDFRMVRDGEAERLLSRGRNAPERADKPGSATEELAALRAADRVAKAASKARKASTAPRKSGARKTAGKARARR
ncbi:ribonuclease R [Rubrivivax gelatinosus]|uniref:Ribonuclease R n=1 Tax=Rubrivivax gelatinosus TaxID=28068 RepID=A0A4V2SHC5_RUBGE|nr:ribonuclease R [Rubrivivax gelatinosus]MBK1688625.1 ribonuclease R [Rubrivivax gelatinosus]TCP04528.1 RNAse R [Rubrivivax gelatinosus]